MSCGDIKWWRAPDFAGLLERHGQIEHLVVQFDFLIQVQRDARAEYSIPGASKSRSGDTGYVDIVSIATSEIWEVKPATLEQKAFDEASWYVKNAKVSCGGSWTAGTSYSISDWATRQYGGAGVVYKREQGGNKAELVAQQRKAGVVVYFWRINGQQVQALSPDFALALRSGLIAAYFKASKIPSVLPGSKPGDIIPPVKFKPPAIRPDACIPQLVDYIPAMLKSIYTTLAPTILEGSSIAVMLHVDVFNMLVGAGPMANVVRLLQVTRANPTASLYAAATSVLIDAARAGGPLEITVGAVKLFLSVSAAVAVVGGVIVATCYLAPIVAGGLAADGLLGSFVAGVGAQALRTVAFAAGATILAFALPRAASADPGTPVAFDLFLSRFILRLPGDAALRLGQSQTIDNAEWLVVGIAETLPD